MTDETKAGITPAEVRKLGQFLIDTPAIRNRRKLLKIKDRALV